MRRMPGGGLRRILIGATAALTLAAMAVPASAGTTPAATVEVRGGDILEPGQFIKNNFRFVPRNITVNSGDVVRWVDRDRSADAPHTVTIARRSDLPQNIAQLDACFAPGALCAETIEAHDPGSDFAPPFNIRVNRGGPGLNARGDSLLFAGPFSQAIQGRVTAPAGRTLFYLCVIHPWMQGSIAVQ
jgi:plastocyanin